MSIKPKVNLRENKNAKKKFKNLQSAKSTLRKLLFLEYLFMNIFFVLLTKYFQTLKT